MNKRIVTKYLPACTLALGLVGLGLRAMMYATCVDGRGLLTRNNPYHIACWILAVLTAGALALATGRRNGINSYSANFPPSVPAALGCWLGSIGMMLTVLLPGDVGTDTTLGLLWKIAGLLSAAGLVYAGMQRLKGGIPHFLSYAAVCVFFALHLICYYQVWSGEPQTADYSFQLLACVLLTLFSYYQTAFAVDTGSRRCQLFAGLMGAFLCCLALAKTTTPWLYLGCTGWLLTNLCTIEPPRRRRFTENQEEVG